MAFCCTRFHGKKLPPAFGRIQEQKQTGRHEMYDFFQNTFNWEKAVKQAAVRAPKSVQNKARARYQQERLQKNNNNNP